MDSAARVENGERPGLARSGSLDLPHHLTEVEFWNDECFHVHREFADLFFGKWPGGDQAQFADMQTAFTRRLDRALSYPRGDSVGDNHYICALELFFLEQGNVV